VIGVQTALKPARRAQASPLLVAAQYGRTTELPARVAATGITFGLVALTTTAAAVGAHTVQSFAATVFFVCASGSGLLQLRTKIQIADFIFLSVATSLTLFLLVGFALAELSFWHPVLAFALLAVVSLGGHSIGLAKAVRATDGPARFRLPTLIRPTARLRSTLFVSRHSRDTCLAGVGAALVLAAALLHRHFDPGRDGMFVRIGPLWYLGIVCLIVALVRSALTANPSTALIALAMVTVLSLTPALLYDYPTVTSAARHVGVAEVIRHAGHLELSQGIYDRWPALFAASGMLWDVGHVTNPLAWARWWPVLMNPMAVLGVRCLGGRLLNTINGPRISVHRLWIAGTMFGTANILGGAYFSPQSTCFVLALVVLWLAIPTKESLAGVERFGRLASLTVIAFAITVTHQLTPYLLLPAIFFLIVFRLVRPWWTLLLVGLPAAGWAFLNRAVLGQFVRLHAVGHVVSNAAPPSHGGSLPYRIQTELAIYLPLLLVLAIGAAAAIVVVIHRSRLQYCLMCCAASPILLFAANSYGNEALFRAALFGLPWLSILVVTGTWSRPRHREAFGILALTSFVAIYSIGTYGLDWYRAIQPGTVNAVKYFELDAPDRSVVVMAGSGNAIPGRLTYRSPEVEYLGRDTLHMLPADSNYNAQSDVLAFTQKILAEVHAPAYYAITTTSLGAYDDLYGIQRYSDFREFENAIAASPYWVPVFVSPSAILYRLAVRPPSGLSAPAPTGTR
jgi:hypothetical protein